MPKIKVTVYVISERAFRGICFTLYEMSCHNKYYDRMAWTNIVPVKKTLEIPMRFCHIRSAELQIRGGTCIEDTSEIIFLISDETVLMVGHNVCSDLFS